MRKMTCLSDEVEQEAPTGIDELDVLKVRKRCRTCNLIKHLVDFHNDTRSKTGTRHQCRACAMLYSRARRIKDAEINKINKMLTKLADARKAYDGTDNTKQGEDDDFSG